MNLSLRHDQFERSPELIVKFFSRVSHHRQSAALRRTILRERRHHDEPAWLDGPAYLGDVGGSIGRVREKVKYCAIMPDRVGSCLQICRADISFEPMDAGCGSAEARTGAVQCAARQIEHREFAVAEAYEIVDEHRCSAADVNDGRIKAWRHATYHGEGALGGGLKPANRISWLCRVHTLPMLFLVHEYTLVSEPMAT
jgi:hypothetical protein